MQGTYYETDRVLAIIIMVITVMIIYYGFLRGYNPREKNRYIQYKKHSKKRDTKGGK